MVERSAARRRRIERVVVMHGTSVYRGVAGRMLVDLLEATGASGAAFGWTDVLAPDLLAPVHVVARRPGLSWTIGGDSPDSDAIDHVETIDDADSLEWKLLLKGASRVRLERVASLLEYAKGYFTHARSREVPSVVDAESSFVALLDALRFCGFQVAEGRGHAIQTAFRDEVPRLPASVRGSAEDVVTALRQRGQLQAALLRLGSELDVAGSFADAAGVHLVGYELALQRGDGIAGLDAARSAGRAFRRLGDLGSSLRWYRLAARIAEVEGDRGRLALALDGAGNTHRHRGSFPRAREAYEEAWGHAVASGDGVAIGNVATSMVIVERWAGNLPAASIYALASLEHRQDPDARARALINLGSLLREGRDLENAELAFSLARHESIDLGYRALATDALAYCAALRGDAACYARWRAEVRDARIREPFLRAQIGYFRALALSALGRPRYARKLLDAVERYARSWGLAQWEIKAAETELPLPQGSPMDTPDEVRQGLQALQVSSS